MPELSELFQGRDAYVPTVPPYPSKRDTSAYHVGGVRVPSVTEVLSLAGLSDFPGIPRNVLENAAHRGKWAHHFTDLIDQGVEFDLKDVPDEVIPRLDAYRMFLSESGFEPVLIEEVVVSHSYRFAGTLDRVGLLPGVGLVLVDVKLPIAKAASWPLQTAGYAFALHEYVGTRVEARFTLQLGDDGRYRLEPHGDDTTDLHDFLAALRVAHFKIRNGIAKLED